MLFRQLYDAQSSTYTYVLGCEETREAVIIDPVYERFDRDTALLRELSLTVRYCLDTHVHADHVTAAWRFQQGGARIGIATAAGAEGFDIGLHDGDVLAFGNHSLRVMETPGHTNGCLTFVTSDRAMAFTGDCLMIRGSGRTDFQAGDAGKMWHSIRERIFSLPDDCLLYPGHDYQGRTVSSVGEEKRYNPRIGGQAREEDFVGYMENLNLPHPKLLEVAVPANMRCGQPGDDAVEPAESWAPVVRTFAGVLEVEPDWVARHRADLQVIDVRSEAEFEQGHLTGSRCIPLETLRERTETLDSSRPTVVVCQSGKRSAMATQILSSAGFGKVANLPGGLIHWALLALPGLDGAS